MYRKNQYKSANFFSNNTDSKNIEYYEYKVPIHNSPKYKDSNIKEYYENTLEKETVIKKIGTSDPKIWGPQLWFILHNGASKYPISASPIYKEKMKDFIKGLPFILPCEKCKIHAIDYIEDYKDKLDDICSGREKLFKFFVDFHNSVNKRYNKPEIDYEYVNKMYY